jgi:serine/threonine protein kinase
MNSIYDYFINLYSGAFSTVYKAIDKTTQMKVAIKVVRRRELNHSQVRNLFDYDVCRVWTFPGFFSGRPAT